MNLRAMIPRAEDSTDTPSHSSIVDGLAEHGILSAEAVCNPANFTTLKMLTGGDVEAALKFKRRVVDATAPASYLASERLAHPTPCLLYTSPSPRDRTRSRMPSSA
eukprot:TRINITY_DN14265_c0_g1_i1.p1 TRINITY_DN14265_c0_g1~~TRINITY_DN14265_c0_g1_i1.p1  ORF type:complete len:106 (-),score=21.89 TRINITY_DN14265_c0_g1_i1:108-425(-)